MSRIGKKEIIIPQGVNITEQNGNITVKGPKGTLQYRLPLRLKVQIADNKLTVQRHSDSKLDKSLHGLARSILQGMVLGVSQGYKKTMEIFGVGYRAQAKNDRITMTLGYSHPIEYILPEGVTATVDDKQTTITLSGIDKQLLGQVAANIRKLRSPDVYKGKGVKYAGERIKFKAGKTGKK